MIASILAAASLAAAPAPAPAQAADKPTPRACLPQMDRQFVLYVAPAASSGPNPLFRLISGPTTAGMSVKSDPMSACKLDLRRTAWPR